MPNLKKILIIQTASIGDVVLSTPVIEKLHQYHPDARIDLLVKKGTEQLFLRHPFLNEVLTWDKPTGKYRDLLRIFRKIRHTSYDAVINLQRFALTGMLTAFSGSRDRIGFSKNPLSMFFTRKVEHGFRSGLHETDRNLKLILHLTGPGAFRPRLYPSDADLAQSEAFKKVPYITISPASLWFTKQFPAEKWLELISRIDPSFPVYLLGSAADIPLCEDLCSRSHREKVTNLAGRLSMLESAGLMKDARMNFTNDSAPLHLASAVNAPVTVIYCSTIPEFGFGPLSEHSVIAETDVKLECRPCGLHGFKACPQKHFRCATTIDTNRLAASIGPLNLRKPHG